MERMNDIETLALLDPAKDRELTTAEVVRAEANLERILATPPATGTQQRRRRVRIGAGVLGSGIAAIAIATAAVVGGGSAAYADWSAVPTPVTAKQSLHFVNDCAETWATSTTLATSDVLLAERRGNATLALVQHDGVVRMCSGVNPKAPVGWEVLYNPGVSTEAPPSEDGLRIYGIETSGSGNESYSYDVGRVGSNVTGVDIETAKGTVTATVHDGWFVAWWPGNDQTDAKIIDVHLKNGATTKSRWNRWS